jgi:hypothetical protein
LRDADDGDLIAAGEVLQRVVSWFRALTGQTTGQSPTEAEAQQRRFVLQVEEWLQRNAIGAPSSSSDPGTRSDVE